MKFLWPAECRKRDVKNAKCESAENAENVENACIKLFIVSAARNANAAKYCIKSSLSFCPFSTPLPSAGVLSERAPFCLASVHFVNLPAQKPKESCLRLQMRQPSSSSSSCQRHFEMQISPTLCLSLSRLLLVLAKMNS